MDGVLSFVGKNFCANGLCLLVVTKSPHIKLIEKSLTNCMPIGINVRVNATENIGQLLKTKCELSFDFIVFIIDTKNGNALNNLMKDVSKIDKHYLAANRICLVVPKDVPSYQTQVLNDDIHSVAASLQAPVLIGHIGNAEGCLSLADQIMNLATLVTGAKTGVPIVLTRSEEEAEYICNVFPSTTRNQI